MPHFGIVALGQVTHGLSECAQQSNSLTVLYPLTHQGLSQKLLNRALPFLCFIRYSTRLPDTCGLSERPQQSKESDCPALLDIA